MIGLLILGGIAWAIWAHLKTSRRPQGERLNLQDVPLSAHEWQRFAALAVAMNKQTKTLLAEAVRYYIEQKTK